VLAFCTFVSSLPGFQFSECAIIAQDAPGREAARLPVRAGNPFVQAVHHIVTSATHVGRRRCAGPVCLRLRSLVV
jgi:hypothetical protein